MRKATKKLVLNRETVRTLTTNELGQAAGGLTTAITCSCPPTKRLDCPSNPDACGP